jgi:hypothetical protein
LKSNVWVSCRRSDGVGKPNGIILPLEHAMDFIAIRTRDVSNTPLRLRLKSDYQCHQGVLRSSEAVLYPHSGYYQMQRTHLVEELLVHPLCHCLRDTAFKAGSVEGWAMASEGADMPSTGMTPLIILSQCKQLRLPSPA